VLGARRTAEEGFISMEIFLVQMWAPEELFQYNRQWGRETSE